MNFVKRLLYYLVGFSVGLVFLFYFMGKKEATFNYSPNKRVLADIEKKQWIFKGKPDTTFLEKNNLGNKFKVDFSQSNVDLDSCKKYVLKYKSKNEKTYYSVENCSNTAKFKKLYY